MATYSWPGCFVLMQLLAPMAKADIAAVADPSAPAIRKLSGHSCEGYDEEVTECLPMPACDVCHPVNCVFSEWNEWYPAGGCIQLKLRTRTVNVENNECGKPCNGPKVMSAVQILPQCVRKVVDCRFAPWSDWTSCETPEDQSVRTRTVVQPPSRTGKTCEGCSKETRPCGTGPEPMHCILSAWQDWTSCSSTCGEGRHTRMRRIEQDAQHGGDVCVDAMLESLPCSLPPCPQADGKVSAWSEWSDCIESGQSQSFRHRDVLQAPVGHGKPLPRMLSETKGCPPKIPTNCTLTEWTPWTPCDRTCGGGQSVRERQLSEPNSKRGHCQHAMMKMTKACGERACYNAQEHDCLLTEWDPWSACSAKCGEGSKLRLRKIKKPATSKGKGCEGPLEETSPCKAAQCLVEDCKWADWYSWSACSCTCGGGTKRRSRVVAVAPRHGGKPCPPMPRSEVAPCNTQRCDDGCIDAKWGPWADWTGCSSSCSPGFRSRWRHIAQEANGCGAPVGGLREQYELCPGLPACTKDADCVLAEWGEWSHCSCSCFGIRERNRMIAAFATGRGKPCDGEPLKVIEPCNDDEAADRICGDQPPEDCVLSDWDEWSMCTLPCGGGQKERKRTITREPARGGKPCDNDLSITAHCNTQSCAAKHCQDCEWGPWSDWGDCSHCGGQRFRHRNIMKMPNQCGRICHPKSAKEVANCQSHCHESRYCAWSEWSKSTSCGNGCGSSSTIRNRIMTLTDKPGPSFFFKGLATSSCSASQLNVSACPVKPNCQDTCTPKDCLFGHWSEWGDPTCLGLCERHRVVKVMNNECGAPCDGSLLETKKCPSDCQLPRDCKLGDWSAWSGCIEEGSVDQGKHDAEGIPSNQRVRERPILKGPRNGGKPCTGNLRETTSCAGASVAPCTLSTWGTWSSCSKSCGPGWKERSREVLAPAQGGGQQCMGRLQEITACGTAPRALGASYGSDAGSSYGKDTGASYGKDAGASYGKGAGASYGKDGGASYGDTGASYGKDSKASYGNDAGSSYGKDSGASYGKDAGASYGKAPEASYGNAGQGSAGCGPGSDCKLGEWSRWSGLDGNNQRFRHRMVTVPATGGGKPCIGALKETETGQEEKVDCRMSEWTPWEKCDRSCGGGQSSRQRQVSRFPSNGGKTCPHQLIQTRGCNTKACSKRDAEISAWGEWSACSTTCGPAMQERKRRVQVLRGPGGAGLAASLGETRACLVKGRSNPPCPVQDCEWRDWADWGDCTCSCGGGQKTRNRVVKKMPSAGGKQCSEEDKEQILPCNTHKCQAAACVDGKFGAWTKWGMCSATCGGGVSIRHRPILVEANDCGKPAEGKTRESRFCNVKVNCEAAVDCLLAVWGEWTPCSATCDGIQRRARTVQRYGRGDGAWCMGALKETRPCNPIEGQAAPHGCSRGPKTDCTMTEWSTWMACSATCGGGMHSRGRKVQVMAKNGGKPCDSSLSEVRECARNDCVGPQPVNCKYGDWGLWGACSKCSGQRNRYRNIVQYADNGGMNCDEHDSQATTSCPRQCHTASYCVWSTWQDWNRCTADCGTGGKRTRRRYLEITSDASQASHQLMPAEELLKKYSDLYIRTQTLEGSHLKELFMAFGAGCLSLILLLGLGVWMTDRGSARQQAGIATRAVSRALGLGAADSRQLPAISASRSQGGARYQSLAAEDGEDFENYDSDVGVELSLRDSIRA